MFTSFCTLHVIVLASISKVSSLDFLSTLVSPIHPSNYNPPCPSPVITVSLEEKKKPFSPLPYKQQITANQKSKSRGKQTAAMKEDEQRLSGAKTFGLFH